MIAYGIIASESGPRVAAQVANKIIDLAELVKHGGFNHPDSACLNQPNLNAFIAAGRPFRSELKAAVVDTLAEVAQNASSKFAGVVFEPSELTLLHPLKVGGFTDFYASKQHATNIGRIFRPQNPLLPNWEHIPIAYNGRASSVVISGHPVKRPHGQVLVGDKPEYRASKKLDLENELGIVIGKENKLGEPIPIDQAADYIFGVCLVNDWSARDLQAWEYQPLGPFTAKSFLTSISAFIIPIEELELFKLPALVQNPTPLAYLQEKNAQTYDIQLEVSLKTPNCAAGTVISRANFKDIYWTMNQWIAHHTVSGCNLQVGDILASGTISGDSEGSFGSLMELTVNGSKPLTLPSGEQRTFLEDGDELIIRAYVGADRQLLGEVAGTVSA